MLVLDGGALVLSKGLLASVLVNSCIAKAFFPCMVLKGETLERQTKMGMLVASSLM